ncbi:MAG: hypothetical protein WC307_04200, partial [Candidatus Nanoarchaeia archaeon]
MSKRKRIDLSDIIKSFKQLSEQEDYKTISKNPESKLIKQLEEYKTISKNQNEHKKIKQKIVEINELLYYINDIEESTIDFNPFVNFTLEQINGLPGITPIKGYDEFKSEAVDCVKNLRESWSNIGFNQYTELTHQIGLTQDIVFDSMEDYIKINDLHESLAQSYAGLQVVIEKKNVLFEIKAKAKEFFSRPEVKGKQAMMQDLDNKIEKEMLNIASSKAKIQGIIKNEIIQAEVINTNYEKIKTFKNQLINLISNASPNNLREISDNDLDCLDKLSVYCGINRSIALHYASKPASLINQLITLIDIITSKPEKKNGFAYYARTTDCKLELLELNQALENKGFSELKIDVNKSDFIPELIRGLTIRMMPQSNEGNIDGPYSNINLISTYCQVNQDIINFYADNNQNPIDDLNSLLIILKNADKTISENEPIKSLLPKKEHFTCDFLTLYDTPALNDYLNNNELITNHQDTNWFDDS